MRPYAILQAFLRLLVRCFFREVHVVGAENVPLDRGGVLVSWHPNGLVDPGLILTSFPRPVVFGARHGLFMWPLLACSILGLAVILVKFVTLQMAKVRTDRLLERVRALVGAGRIDDAVDLCANTRGPVASILLTGLHLYEEGGSRRADQAIVHAGRIEMAFLEKGLVVLATVSNVAPLIGFLGTVAGMILAFGAIEAAGEVEAQLVAGGIKVNGQASAANSALNCTKSCGEFSSRKAAPMSL